MKKTIFITGASSGIGKATAIFFQENGWNVVATMRQTEKGAELSKLAGVLVERLDVLDLDSIQEAIAAGIKAFGKIDVLLNNAGYGAYGPLEAFPRENMVRQFQTNVIGLLDVTRAMIPHFRQNQAGRIINISSVGGKLTFPLGTLYHGSKFAVEGLSEALSYEMEQIGVSVKLIEPGFTATDFGSRSFDFQNREDLTEYQGVVGALFKGWESASGNISAPTQVVEVIWTAANDEDGPLRYRAGADTEHLLNTREQLGEEAFLKMMKEQYGLVAPIKTSNAEQA